MLKHLRDLVAERQLVPYIKINAFFLRRGGGSVFGSLTPNQVYMALFHEMGLPMTQDLLH